MCIDNNVLCEPEDEYGLTPLHHFLGLAWHFPNEELLWEAGLINRSHGPDQLYQGILRQLVPNDGGIYFSEEDIANHKDKKALVDLIGESKYMGQEKLI